MFPSIYRDNYLPEPAQLELFDNISTAPYKTGTEVKAGSLQETKSNDIQIRSPTENADQFERKLNKTGASVLNKKSRALVKKFFQNQNNQTSPGNDL